MPTVAFSLWGNGRGAGARLRAAWGSVDAVLKTHCVVLATIATGTLFLVLWPEAILRAGYHCELQVLLGLRCPFCGMTRDFAAILHGGTPTQNPCSWFAACAIYLLYPAGVFVAWKWKRLDAFYGRFARAALGVALAVMLILNNWR